MQVYAHACGVGLGESGIKAGASTLSGLSVCVGAGISEDREADQEGQSFPPAQVCHQGLICVYQALRMGGSVTCHFGAAKRTPAFH